VATEVHQDVTHLEDTDVDATTAHEGKTAVAHTVETPPAETSKSPTPKFGFKLFGKTPKPKPETETPPTLDVPSVEAAKEEALKAVEEAVESSKEQADAAVAEKPKSPTTEKKGFLGFFSKKPTAPPPVAETPNEETVVVTSETDFSDVITSEGEKVEQSKAGFFSKLKKGKDKEVVEVKSAEESTTDIITAEGETHAEHVAGTEADVSKEGTNTDVNVKSFDEAAESDDK